MRGIATSTAEVTNISEHGFWVLVDGYEYFLPFDEFPWFKRAPVEALLRVERLTAQHLHCRSWTSIYRWTRSRTQSATRSPRSSDHSVRERGLRFPP